MRLNFLFKTIADSFSLSMMKSLENLGSAQVLPRKKYQYPFPILYKIERDLLLSPIYSGKYHSTLKVKFNKNGTTKSFLRWSSFTRGLKWFIKNPLFSTPWDSPPTFLAFIPGTKFLMFTLASFFSSRFHISRLVFYLVKELPITI